jgi:hypothetical protein
VTLDAVRRGKWSGARAGSGWLLRNLSRVQAGMGERTGSNQEILRRIQKAYDLLEVPFMRDTP